MPLQPALSQFPYSRGIAMKKIGILFVLCSLGLINFGCNKDETKAPAPVVPSKTPDKMTGDKMAPATPPPAPTPDKGTK
jgi:hypothetical protein